MVNIVTKVRDWQSIRRQLRGKSIGLVPTMGHLHAGHLSLCQRAKKENDICVASIFVNPTQFNQSSDYALYPRTMAEDETLLSQQQVDYLFAPEAEAIYADEYEVQITETVISKELEGVYRPGHFTGVLTVVLKLCHLVQATGAYFGEKDYQQLLLIKKMAAALFLPTNIVSCDTIRAEDGLALSSRNSRLTPAQRKHAGHVYRLLSQATLSVEEIKTQLMALGFKVDYVAEQWGRRLAAVWLDDVRLIDNVAQC